METGDDFTETIQAWEGKNSPIVGGGEGGLEAMGEGGVMASSSRQDDTVSVISEEGDRNLWGSDSRRPHRAVSADAEDYTSAKRAFGFGDIHSVPRPEANPDAVTCRISPNRMLGGKT